ncbi:hypothetical protein K438DRAFT_2103580 [Mycena galopus ATCC 62051]|nr:hypothetical protein K438DRAFT_2103580 [Mycena galopus ATCC 62051]
MRANACFTDITTMDSAADENANLALALALSEQEGKRRRGHRRVLSDEEQQTNDEEEAETRGVGDQQRRGRRDCGGVEAAKQAQGGCNDNSEIPGVRHNVKSQITGYCCAPRTTADLLGGGRRPRKKRAFYPQWIWVPGVELGPATYILSSTVRSPIAAHRTPQSPTTPQRFRVSAPILYEVHSFVQRQRRIKSSVVIFLGQPRTSFIGSEREIHLGQPSFQNKITGLAIFGRRESNPDLVELDEELPRTAHHTRLNLECMWSALRMWVHSEFEIEIKGISVGSAYFQRTSQV